MKIFLAFFIFTLLASCTILDKTGIEKRRYRSGYYISSASSKPPSYKQISENMADEKMDRVHQPIDKIEEPENNNLVAITSPEKLVSLHHEKAMPYAFSKAKSVIKKINYMTPVYNFFKESTAVCAAKKTKEAKDWIGGCGDILAEIIILILALAILAIFPNITVPAAELLAMCVLIVAAIFIFIIVGRH